MRRSRSRKVGSWDTTRGDIEEVCNREMINMVEERTKAAAKVSIIIAT
jgi:hypothetical protein